MERYGVASGGVGHQLGSSQLTFWLPTPAVMLVQISGHGEAAFVEPVTAAIDGCIVANARPRLFFEIEGMPRYDPAFRINLTSYFLRTKQEVASLALVTSSTFALMGATVANLVLQDFIQVFSRRAEFDLAVDTALREAGVSNVSSAIFRTAATQSAET